MHVSGSATTKNEPFVENDVLDIPFNYPTGVLAAQVDASTAIVSLNGNVLDAADYTLTIEDGPVFQITNASSTLEWPSVSNITVQCDVIVDYNDNPDAFDAYDWMELLKAQAVQLADLEARVSALEP